MSGVLPTTTQDLLVKSSEQLSVEHLGHIYFELTTRYAPEGSALSLCLSRPRGPNPNYRTLLTTTLTALQSELKNIPDGTFELREIDRYFGSENLTIEHFRALADKIHKLVENNIWGHFEEQKEENHRDDWLDISNCNPPLTIVSPSIHRLRSLTSLNLQQNALTELPEELFRLEGLTALHLAANRLKSIPAAIGRLHNLRVLDVEENRLESLPSTLENLTELEVLRAPNNRLTKFELNTSRMHRLRALYLYNNRMTSVTLHPATRVGHVHLENNLLTQFPNVEVLPKGCLIALSGNPLNEDDVRTFKNEALQLYFAGYEKPELGKKRSHPEVGVNKQ